MSIIYRAISKSFPIVGRGFHIYSKGDEKATEKIQFNLSGYYKYGLYHDDLYLETHPVVIEALRRLPEEKRLQRIYRAIRAQHAELNHTCLPKEQWSKFEDDHYYLQPYITEIYKELEEIREWEANY